MKGRNRPSVVRAEENPALFLCRPGPSGRLLIDGFFCPAIGHFELLIGDGLTIHGTDNVHIAGICKAAYAPEDKDKDNDTKGHFDPEGLGIGANNIKH